MLDRTDREIVKRLQVDGRKPFTEIATELNISEGTIRNRVKRLVEQRAIQIIGMIDPTKLGYDAPAMIGVQVEQPRLEEIVRVIAEFPEVSYLIMVSGEFDLFVEVLCKDRQALAAFLNEKLTKVGGIVRTQTYFTLRTFKMAQGAKPVFLPVNEATPELSGRGAAGTERHAGLDEQQYG